MNIKDLKKMSVIERLQAMEILWDSMLYEDGELVTPEWHERILEVRKRKIANGSAELMSLAELKERSR